MTRQRGSPWNVFVLYTIHCWCGHHKLQFVHWEDFTNSGNSIFWRQISHEDGHFIRYAATFGYFKRVQVRCKQGATGWSGYSKLRWHRDVRSLLRWSRHDGDLRISDAGISPSLIPASLDLLITQGEIFVIHYMTGFTKTPRNRNLFPSNRDMIKKTVALDWNPQFLSIPWGPCHAGTSNIALGFIPTMDMGLSENCLCIHRKNK